MVGLHSHSPGNEILSRKIRTFFWCLFSVVCIFLCNSTQEAGAGGERRM